MEVNVKLQVKEQMVIDTIITALEGGSNYWYLLDEVPERLENMSRVETIGSLIHNDPTFELKVYDLEDEDTLLGTVTQESFKKALEARPKETMQLIDESYDSTTADILFQVATMGEITFG